MPFVQILYSKNKLYIKSYLQESFLFSIKLNGQLHKIIPSIIYPLIHQFTQRQRVRGAAVILGSTVKLYKSGMADPQANKIISLSSWPTHPVKSADIQLTPVSKEVFLESGLVPSEIIPKYFDEFADAERVRGTSNKMLKERYYEYEQRRLRKIAMLKKIRGDKLQPHTQETKPSKSLAGMTSTRSTKNTIYNSNENIKSKLSNNSISLSRNKAKSFSRRKNYKKGLTSDSTHTQYYGNMRNTPALKSVSTKKTNRRKEMTSESSSKKIQRKSSKSSKWNPVEQYYDSSGKKNNHEEKNSIPSELKLFETMSRCITEWEFMNQRQAEEILNPTKLSEKEMKRLRKIHEIEKEKIRAQMTQTKIKIDSLSQSLSHTNLIRNSDAGNQKQTV